MTIMVMMTVMVMMFCACGGIQNCLLAFEQFTGRKSCPMCRKEAYQTRVVHEGVTHLRHKMATVYASVGFLLRKVHFEWQWCSYRVCKAYSARGPVAVCRSGGGGQTNPVWGRAMPLSNLHTGRLQPCYATVSNTVALRSHGLRIFWEGEMYWCHAGAN